MPRRQPFTRLCQLSAALARPVRADLHVHTTASDGDWTPSQVIALARQSGLATIAITDHDTIAGHAEAREAIRLNAFRLDFVPGLEISTFHGCRDLHLLAYDFQLTDGLFELLTTLQAARRNRFLHMVDALRGRGLEFAPNSVEFLLDRGVSLGRRHLATMLVEAGIVTRRYDAFRQYLLPLGWEVDSLRAVALRDAIAIVHDAGGFTSLAHPPENISFEELTILRDLGLDAIEAIFPAATLGRTRYLQELASRLGLGCTGGSDSHGADRPIGSRSIQSDEWQRLRRMADPVRRSELSAGASDTRSRD